MSELPPLRYLAAADVRRALPMTDAIAAVREAFIQLGQGRAVVPTRMRLDVAGEDTVFLLMPSLGAAPLRFGLKCVAVAPANPTRDLPLIHSLVLLADAATGVPLAIIDGGALTAIRTGAASGVATEALARPDARAAAVFGAGVQARTQLEAVCAVRPIRRARVFDPRPAIAAQFAREMTQRLGIPVEPASTPGEAVQEADVVCTVSTSHEPVFADADLRPGVHINAVGVFQPDRAEVPPETVCRARVVVDQLEAACDEAGDLLRPLAAGLITRDHFATELGDVLVGAKPGRQQADQITLFKSVGVAIQDLCAAQCALDNARRLGIGLDLPR